MKSVRIWSFSGAYSVQMRENTLEALAEPDKLHEQH